MLARRLFRIIFVIIAMSSPNPALPPSLPAGDSSRPANARRQLLRVLGWAVAAVAAGCAAFIAYAAIYPERMPLAIGTIVEDITGANPQPVALHVPPSQPLRLDPTDARFKTDVEHRGARFAPRFNI